MSAVFLVIWSFAHKFAFNQIQNGNERYAELNAEHEKAIAERNDALMELSDVKKRVDEAEMWVAQLAEEIKELREIHDDWEIRH